jgi:hypothetical protein
MDVDFHTGTSIGLSEFTASLAQLCDHWTDTVDAKVLLLSHSSPVL